MEIEEDYSNSRPVNGYYSPEVSAIPLSSAGSTTQKVHGLSVPTPGSASHSSLTDKVTFPTRGETSYPIRLQQLIAQILLQLDLINREVTQPDTKELRQKYRNRSLETAGLQRELGVYNLKSALVVFGSSLLQFLSPHQSDREMITTFANQVVGKLGEMGAASKNGEITKASNEVQMLLQQYQAKTNDSQSNSSNKQELIRLADEILATVKRAAQGQG